MPTMFDKDCLNLLLRHIASEPSTKSLGIDEIYHNITPKPTIESTRTDERYQNSAPKPTIESTRMDESYQNSAPKPTTSKGTNEELLSQLAPRLKGLIRHAVAQVKEKSQAFIELQAANNEVVRATPLSCHIPQDYDPNVLSMSEKKRQKAVLVGELETSFEVHEDYALKESELDKLPALPHHLSAQIKPGVKRDVGLKFPERLKGWKLQCKQRFDGKLDVYFHHINSKEFFRSSIEVVNFILYEICPRHLMKRATKAPNENFSGSNRDGAVPMLCWISSCSPSSGGKSTKEHSTIGVHEVEETATKETFKTSNKDTTNKIGKGKSPQRLNGDKHMKDIEASTASSEATIEDVFHLENIQGTKRRRTEYSSSATSGRVGKSITLSPDFVKASSVDDVSDANVKAKDKMASTSEPGQVEDMPKPAHNPYQYDLAIHLANLRYRRLDYDDFFM